MITSLTKLLLFIIFFYSYSFSTNIQYIENDDSGISTSISNCNGIMEFQGEDAGLFQFS